MTKRIAHLGIAVRSLEEAIPFYRDTLGLTFGGIEEVPGYGVKVAFLVAGESKLELLEPTSKDGMVGEFLRAHGPGFHHVAFEVDDIEAAIEACTARGVGMIDRAPRLGAHGARVAFVDPGSSGSVLTELLQLPDATASRSNIGGSGVTNCATVLRRTR